MESIIINEESTAWLQVTFTDREGVEVIPSSVVYRIDNIHGNVTPETPITPDTTIEIEITPNENKIEGDSSEMRNVVTVVSQLGTNQQQTREFEYKIKNLRYL